LAESETDHLPIGPERALWDDNALAAKDEDIRRFEAALTKDVFESCRLILCRFGDGDVSEQ
jgi:hypothetical protein